MLRVFPWVTLPVSFVPETSLLTPLTVIVIIIGLYIRVATVRVGDVFSLNRKNRAAGKSEVKNIFKHSFFIL